MQLGTLENTKKQVSNIPNYPAWVWFVGSMALAIAVLCYRLNDFPVEVWDEARNANNALEMFQSGWSLITTYDGKPDHWNTKPPLLIWIMSLSIKAFGPIELSLRIPSILASLATMMLVFSFCTYQLKRPIVGFLAILVLLTSTGYVQIHGARSGNFDPLLTLWTTGFLLSGYMYLQEDTKRKTLWLFLCTVGVLLAFFTKTIQGLIFLPALLLYAFFYHSITHILKSLLVYVYSMLTVLICVGYYMARESVDPGYLQIAMGNDLFGRYNTVIEDHRGSVFYYVTKKAYPWLALSLIIAAVQFWRGKDAELRKISIFLGLATFIYLAVISSASTKLLWYASPLTPLSAIIIGIAGYQLLEGILKQSGVVSRLLVSCFPILVIVISTIVFVGNSAYLNAEEKALKANEQELYGFFLRAPVIQDETMQKFALIYQGYNDGSTKDYVGPVLFYINLLRAQGREIIILPPSAVIPEDFGRVALCGAKIKNEVELNVTLRPIKLSDNCGIYAVIR